MASRIALLTDEPVLAAGLEAVLENCEIDSTGDTGAFPDLVARRQPAVLIVDADHHDRLPLILRLRAQFPGSRILVWQRWPHAPSEFLALGPGALAVVAKTQPASELVACVRALLAGRSWAAPGPPAAGVARLSRRERQLVALVAAGKRNREIGAALAISPATVRVYLTALFRKVGVKSRVELATYGLRHLSHMIAAHEERHAGSP